MNFTPATSRPNARAGLRGRLMLVLAMSALLVGLLPAPVQAGWLYDTWPGSSATPDSEAGQVLELARKQVGKQYKYATAGPDTFDCSGLVWFLFKSTGLADRIGGKRRGAAGYLKWFKANGHWSKNLADARPGDILIWGGGKHAGIYVSGNVAVSALNSRYDVRIHRADPMGLAFTAVLKVPMSRGDGGDDTTTTPDDPPTADPGGAPMPPTTLTAEPQDELQVALSWSGATGAATPLKYRVYRNGAYYVSTKNTSLVDHPWLPGHYTYQIQTVDANGVRSFRSVEAGADAYFDGTDLSVSDNTPPTAPTGLTAQPLGGKQVALSWDASSDKSSVGYLVKRGKKIVARVFATSYVDTTKKEKTYKYRIIAFDLYGNNAVSAAVYATSVK